MCRERGKDDLQSLTQWHDGLIDTRRNAVAGNA